MKMTKPELMFIEFNTQDVITTSGEGGGGNDGLQMNFGNPVTTSIPAPDSAAENKGYGGWSFGDTTTQFNQ